MPEDLVKIPKCRFETERFEKPVSRASRASRPWVFVPENSHVRDARKTPMILFQSDRPGFRTKKSLFFSAFIAFFPCRRGLDNDCLGSPIFSWSIHFCDFRDSEVALITLHLLPVFPHIPHRVRTGLSAIAERKKSSDTPGSRSIATDSPTAGRTHRRFETLPAVGSYR